MILFSSEIYVVLLLWLYHLLVTLLSTIVFNRYVMQVMMVTGMIDRKGKSKTKVD